MYRQGDVLIVPCEKLNFAGAGLHEVPRENGRVILAHGEQTGHSHAIGAPAAVLFRNSFGALFLHAPDGATVEHEEHKALELPSGDFSVTTQRRADPERTVRASD
jgi:hypothetical protein